MTTGKTIVLTRQIFVGKVMSLLFNTLSRLVLTFLSRSKHLLISWLQSASVVMLEPKKIKLLTVSIVSPSICYEVMGPDAMIFIFWMLSFKPGFHSPFSLSSRGSLVPLLSAIRVVSSAYLRLLMFLSAILIPACASSSLVLRIMYSAYKLNKQGDNIQPWCTPFPTLNQSFVPINYNSYIFNLIDWKKTESILTQMSPDPIMPISAFAFPLWREILTWTEWNFSQVNNDNGSSNSNTFYTVIYPVIYNLYNDI